MEPLRRCPMLEPIPTSRPQRSAASDHPLRKRSIVVVSVVSRSVREPQPVTRATSSARSETTRYPRAHPVRPTPGTKHVFADSDRLERCERAVTPNRAQAGRGRSSPGLPALSAATPHRPRRHRARHLEAVRLGPRGAWRIAPERSTDGRASTTRGASEKIPDALRDRTTLKTKLDPATSASSTSATATGSRWQTRRTTDFLYWLPGGGTPSRNQRTFSAISCSGSVARWPAVSSTLTTQPGTFAASHSPWAGGTSTSVPP